MIELWEWIQVIVKQRLRKEQNVLFIMLSIFHELLLILEDFISFFISILYSCLSVFDIFWSFVHVLLKTPHQITSFVSLLFFVWFSHFFLFILYLYFFIWCSHFFSLLGLIIASRIFVHTCLRGMLTNQSFYWRW